MLVIVRRVLGLVIFLGSGLLLPSLAWAAVPTEWTTTTASYKLVLDIGPVETMLMPDQAKGASSGEVMVAMPGMPMPQMVMTDQGHAVNRHLEVHIVNKATGAVVSNLVPTITLTNQMTNQSRQLSSAMPMYGVKEGMSDLHFGNNLYLPDGSYTITVMVGSEQAVFKNVAVSTAGMAAPMPMPAPMPAGMPKSGGLPLGLPVAVAGGLVGIGIALRWRRFNGRR